MQLEKRTADSGYDLVALATRNLQGIASVSVLAEGFVFTLEGVQVAAVSIFYSPVARKTRLSVWVDGLSLAHSLATAVFAVAPWRPFCHLTTLHVVKLTVHR